MPEEPSAPTASQTVTTTGGNNKFLKIVLIVLGVVLLIVISEVGYLIFTNRDISLFKFGQTAVQKEQERPIINATPPPLTFPPLSKNETGEVVVDSDKARVFAGTLDHLESKNKLESSDIATINYEFSGVVIASVFEEKEIGGTTYIYRLSIKRQNGSEMDLWLSDVEVSTIQISLSADGANRGRVSITDIKPGDYVVIKTIINLLDTSPHSKVILEVQRQG